MISVPLRNMVNVGYMDIVQRDEHGNVETHKEIYTGSIIVDFESEEGVSDTFLSLVPVSRDPADPPDVWKVRQYSEITEDLFFMASATASLQSVTYGVSGALVGQGPAAAAIDRVDVWLSDDQTGTHLPGMPPFPSVPNVPRFLILKMDIGV